MTRKFTLIAVALASLACAAPASARTFSGSVSLPKPQGTPSLNHPTPDPARTAEYLSKVSASYGDGGGSLTVRFSLWDSRKWGSILNVSDPWMDPQGYLGDQNGDIVGFNFSVGSLSGDIRTDYDPDGNRVGNVMDVGLDGYDGTISVPVRFDGVNFTATVRNTHFRYQWDWRDFGFDTGRDDGWNSGGFRLRIPGH